MAAVFKDRDARSSLSYMAQAWLRLAERNDFMPPTAQPVVQKQQQIPPTQSQRGARWASMTKIVSDFALFSGEVAFIFAIVLVAATLFA
jgi:hypothetical protein